LSAIDDGDDDSEGLDFFFSDADDGNDGL